MIAVTVALIGVQAHVLHQPALRPTLLTSRVLRQRVGLATGDEPGEPDDDESTGPTRRDLGQSALLVGTSFYLGGLLGEVGDQEVLEAIKRRRVSAGVKPMAPVLKPPTPAVGATIQAATVEQAVTTVGSTSEAKLPAALVVPSAVLALGLGLVSATPLLEWGKGLLTSSELDSADGAREADAQARAPEAVVSVVTVDAVNTTVYDAAAALLPPPPAAAPEQVAPAKRGKLSVAVPVPTKRDLVLGARVLTAGTVLSLLLFVTPAGAALRVACTRAVAQLFVALGGTLSAFAGSAVWLSASFGGALARASSSLVGLLGAVVERLVSGWALMMFCLVSGIKGAGSLLLTLYAPVIPVVADALASAFGALRALAGALGALLLASGKASGTLAASAAESTGAALLAGGAAARLYGPVCAAKALLLRDAAAAALDTLALAAGAGAEATAAFLVVAAKSACAYLLAAGQAVGAVIATAWVLVLKFAGVGVAVGGSAAKAGLGASVKAASVAGAQTQASAPIVAAQLSAALSASLELLGRAIDVSSNFGVALAAAAAKVLALLLAKAALVLAAGAGAMKAALLSSAEATQQLLVHLVQLLSALRLRPQ
ncbi:hypothetical protein T492DRAFT_999024 [Pavlovales sp. CCMP2436]|nr:hypothetical protein T492DRAFT_999024 [Pavlovales sp. CCMP2436]|mmetsp:Transcript_8929/g.23541  ORF Transcript_8929/g.23541 Transcript_8929/m.23541 type:complete len:602 (+) Transcript_8929:58-1863(+)